MFDAVICPPAFTLKLLAEITNSFEFVDEENEEDYWTDQKGVRFFIDPKSRPVLLDSVVEFRTEGLNAGLDIINPNTRDKCGCGESFSI